MDPNRVCRGQIGLHPQRAQRPRRHCIHARQVPACVEDSERYRRAVESLITSTLRLWTLLRSVPGDSPVGLTLSRAELKAIDGAKAGGASPQRSPGLDLWMATKRGNKRFAFSVYSAVIM